MKKLAQGFNTAAQDSNPGSLSRESGGLPLSHCAISGQVVKNKEVFLNHRYRQLGFENGRHMCVCN